MASAAVTCTIILLWSFYRSPVSKADSCTDESRMLLRYQACPDVHNSESTGTWALLFYALYVVVYTV